MGLSRELEQLKRRANRVAIATQMPEIKILVYHEGDEPPVHQQWQLRIMIKRRD